MKAWVKSGNLPDAPKPTLPSRAEDPRDRARREHYMRQFSVGEIKLMSHQEYVEKKKKGRPSLWNERRKKLTIQMWEEGKSIREISRAIGMTLEATKFRISQLKEANVINSRHYKANPSMQDYIRKLYREGMTQGEISEKTGLSPSTINRIICRRKQ